MVYNKGSLYFIAQDGDSHKVFKSSSLHADELDIEEIFSAEWPLNFIGAVASDSGELLLFIFFDIKGSEKKAFFRNSPFRNTYARS